MKKAVITILGTAGCQYNKEKNRYVLTNKKIYEFNNENLEYYNTLPLLIEKYRDDYEIIPIYTDISKQAQEEVLETSGLEISFNLEYKIQDSNNYQELLQIINKAVTNSQYEKLIIDLTHGFRHIPILATISLIIANIKNPEKIEHIWFAQEEVKEVNSDYKIIDLREYLDLANLSFILANFKDNYTVSKHIQTKDDKFMNLITNMNNFSSDIMSLSLENLLDLNTQKLLDSIDELLEKDIILKHELKELKLHIQKIFSKEKHRYLTYFKLAKNLFEKGYLVHTISLLFEGVGFYAKSSFEKYDSSLKEYIHSLEDNLKDGIKTKVKSYYDLTTACRSYLIYEKYNKKTNKGNRDKLLKKYENIIYSNLPYKKEFVNFIWDLTSIRNNLLHSNAANRVNDIHQKVEKLLKNYEKFCIKENVLQKNNSKKIKDISSGMRNNFRFKGF